METNETIVSTITASSGGSVCMIRISGKDAIEITNKFFPSVDLTQENGGSFFFGKLIDHDSNIIDEIVLYLYRSPRSFTGEDIIEVSCHSNIFIIEEILELYIKEGCRIAEPGEYSKRAFLNGKIDLAQAEAIADLIAAKSKIGVQNSLQILGGALTRKIENLKLKIIDIASLLELDLDFSEEDLDVVPKEKYFEIIESSIEEIDALLNSYQKGRDFQKGIEVLITGRPNVGKSSLMNAFLQKDRVIVSSVPGTTRDMVHEDIIIKNTLVRLIDTAGIRISEDQIEKEGVQKARQLLSSAEIILLIFDLADKISSDDIIILDEIVKDNLPKLILVGNKVDKNVNNDSVEFIKKIGAETVFISAKEGKNITVLQEAIFRHIARSNIKEKEEIVISNMRQYEILKRVKNLLHNNLEAFISDEGFEFIAADLRITIDALSEITGEISTDDILNNIFSKFCIGK